MWEEHSQQEVYYEERRADTQEELVECSALKQRWNTRLIQKVEGKPLKELEGEFVFEEVGKDDLGLIGKEADSG